LKPSLWRKKKFKILKKAKKGKGGHLSICVRRGLDYLKKELPPAEKEEKEISRRAKEEGNPQSRQLLGGKKGGGKGELQTDLGQRGGEASHYYDPGGGDKQASLGGGRGGKGGGYYPADGNQQGESIPSSLDLGGDLFAVLNRLKRKKKGILFEGERGPFRFCCHLFRQKKRKEEV